MRTDRGWKRFYATGWFVSALIGAAAIHQWQGRLRAIEERLAESERTRRAVVERVAADERLRIARELHDSLTHSISVIKVQSGVAAHLARKRGEEVPEALQAIEQAAGDAARELRQTLRVLRRHDERDDVAAGLDDLPDLLERARAAGLDTCLEVRGRARELPAEVDAAAYRIVQEALTNVVRHAGSPTARVQVDYRPGWVVLRIDDDGVGQREDAPTPGLGLVGMRERTSALGGHLAVGGRPGGGFTVRAELPAAEAA